MSLAGRGLQGVESTWFNTRAHQHPSFQYPVFSGEHPAGGTGPACLPKFGIGGALCLSSFGGWVMASDGGFALHFPMTSELESLFQGLPGPLLFKCLLITRCDSGVPGKRTSLSRTLISSPRPEERQSFIFFVQDEPRQKNETLTGDRQKEGVPFPPLPRSSCEQL